MCVKIRFLVRKKRPLSASDLAYEHTNTHYTELKVSSSYRTEPTPSCWHFHVTRFVWNRLNFCAHWQSHTHSKLIPMAEMNVDAIRQQPQQQSRQTMVIWREKRRFSCVLCSVFGNRSFQVRYANLKDCFENYIYWNGMMSLNDQRDPTTRLLNLFIIFSYKLNRIQQQTETATKKHPTNEQQHTHTSSSFVSRVFV